MSESATLQPGPSSDVLPAPSDGPGLPCERCGTFIQGTAQKIGVRQVCDSCAALLRKDIRLYPTWYVFLLGILGNFTIAAVLSAINWKRLGDRNRMRNALIVAGVGVALTTLVFILQFRVRGGLIANAIGTRVAAQAIDTVYEQHKKAGGARANLLWPVVIVVGIFAAVVLGYIGYLLATGQLPPEE